MKKMIMVLAIVFILFGYVFCGYIENHYTREARVSTIENNTITFIDKNNNKWTWEEADCENFIMGQPVKLVMSTNYTLDTIDDDIITKVKIDH